MEQRYFADRNAEGAGACPDRKGWRVVELRPLGFRGSEQAQTARAALPYPVAQIVSRVGLQRVRDAHAGDVAGISGQHNPPYSYCHICMRL
jgi:hypothetical protein